MGGQVGWLVLQGWLGCWVGGVGRWFDSVRVSKHTLTPHLTHTTDREEDPDSDAEAADAADPRYRGTEEEKVKKLGRAVARLMAAYHDPRPKRARARARAGATGRRRVSSPPLARCRRSSSRRRGRWRGTTYLLRPRVAREHSHALHDVRRRVRRFVIGLPLSAHKSVQQVRVHIHTPYREGHGGRQGRKTAPLASSAVLEVQCAGAPPAH